MGGRARSRHEVTFSGPMIDNPSVTVLLDTSLASSISNFKSGMVLTRKVVLAVEALDSFAPMPRFAATPAAATKVLWGI